jgi:beta-lactamase regulating signal transducer with metallopeptidase domain
MSDALASPLIVALAITLIHSLWQAALIAVAYRMVLRTRLGRTATDRYRFGLAALAAVIVVSMATFAVCFPQRTNTSSPNLVAAGEGMQSATRVETDEAVGGGDGGSSAAQFRRPEATARRGGGPLIETAAPWIVTAWFSGIAVCGGRLLLGCAWIVHLRGGRDPLPPMLAQRGRLLARRVGVTDVVIACSRRIGQAAVVGLIRPAVLIPTSWITAMPPEVLESIIAHELAHVRRADVWIGLLQRFVETFYFFHPAVLWLSADVRLQREMCCDEIAAELIGQPQRYARALETVGRWSVQTTPEFALPFTGDRKMNLLCRVRNVLGMDSRREADSASLVGLIALMVPAVIFLTQLSAVDNRVLGQEGDRGVSAEAEAGPRVSPEAELRQRRSPEAELRDRRAELDERERDNLGERERGDRERAEGEQAEGRDPLGRFRPANDRERVLVEMIRQLQREVSLLRREVRGGGMLERGDVAQRYREGEPGEVQRDSVERSGRLQDNWRRTREGRVFMAYDKNRDGQVTLDEWLAMTNGYVNETRQELQTRRFNQAEPSGDGKFTPQEFVYWYGVGRFEDADGEGEEARPRRRLLRDNDQGGERRSRGDGDETGERPRLSDGDRSGERRRFGDGDEAGERPRLRDREG